MQECGCVSDGSEEPLRLVSSAPALCAATTRAFRAACDRLRTDSAKIQHTKSDINHGGKYLLARFIIVEGQPARWTVALPVVAATRCVLPEGGGANAGLEANKGLRIEG